MRDRPQRCVRAALAAIAATPCAALNPYRNHDSREPCMSVSTPHSEVCFPTRCAHLFQVDDGGRLVPEPQDVYPQDYPAFGCNVTTFLEYPSGSSRECLRPTCWCKYGYHGGNCQPAVRHGCIRHACSRDPVGSESNPGLDCDDIRLRRPPALRVDGSYWVGNSTQAAPEYCDLQSLGRAWRLIMRDSSVLATNLTNPYAASATAFGDPHGGPWERYKADCGWQCSDPNGAVMFKATFLSGEGPLTAPQEVLPSGFYNTMAAIWYGSLVDLAGSDDNSCDPTRQAYSGTANCVLSNSLSLLVRNSSCPDPGDQRCPGWVPWSAPPPDWFGNRTEAASDELWTQLGATDLLWIDPTHLADSTTAPVFRSGADPAILKREVFVWTPPPNETAT
eukprot:TRINITY_DN21419_c0_g1_i1.p1 TRINITY_DN21419_c0_g1~~TRINITY_DN21419_c0_g1_i1.p1  ORF type:complete len:391 (+),score=52.83 TRINITY_DN21419_c0_g1_i1:86-1258(+)